jgi:methylmalonyl-CoA mutase
LFSIPSEVARQAIENDVHIIGVSSQAAGHKTMIPQLMAELKKAKAEDIIVIIGGVIPKHDYEFLKDAGVRGIFGPGTPIPSAAEEVLDIIQAGS